MALPGWPSNDIHGSISFADGAGSPATLTGEFTRGDIAISGLGGDGLNEGIIVKARGKNVGVIPGERLDPQISFSAFFMGEAASAPGSIAAWWKRQTPYTGLVSTLGAGRFFASDVTITIEQSDFTSGASDWSTTFHDCILSDFSMSEDRGGNYVSFTLICTGEITGSLALNEYGA